MSALWILIANGWMQNPVGAEFNYETMRMELTSFADLFFNPVAQVKFVHTVAAGYVTGAVFVLGISSYYLLKGRDIPFARRSFAVASGFGLASILSVIVLGDESGYKVGEVQKVKLAVMESEWETHEPPAAFTLFGLPNQEEQRTDYAIKIPYVMGIIATRSINEEVTGIKDLIKEHEDRIRTGMLAYAALQKLRAGDKSPDIVNTFEQHQKDLGYALLLKRYTTSVTDATEEQIKQAALNSIPRVAPMFWVFRIMVGFGFFMLLLFGLSFYYCAKRVAGEKRWLLKMALYSIPLPFLASEAGWFVAEFGRQPWAIGEILPTFLATSTLETSDLIFSLGGFIFFYTLLLIAEMYLMFKYARLGPSSLHTGRYDLEQADKKATGGDAGLSNQPAQCHDKGGVA
jgi:cytochrome d ubiquinol oxidase subunit I